MILGGLGTNFHDFCCPARLVVIGLFPGLSNNNSKNPETDSRDPETETGGLETELIVHRIHGTLETGLHRIPGILVAPTRGAGGFLLRKIYC